MQTELEENIQLVQVTIEDAMKVVEFGAAIERLLKNKDFQTVIDIGYFTQEARRLTLFSADPNITADQRDASLRSINAIGELHMFLLTKQRMALEMAKNVEVYKQGLEEMQADADAGETE